MISNDTQVRAGLGAPIWDPREIIPVEQIDRDSALEAGRTWARWSPKQVEIVEQGQGDDCHLVQAFARHRIAAEARSHDGDHVGEVNDMVERCARVAEVAERHWDGIAERGGITQDDIFISSDEAYVVAGAMASLKNKFRSLSAVPLLDEGRL